jgi:hypothetical protein
VPISAYVIRTDAFALKAALALWQSKKLQCHVRVLTNVSATSLDVIALRAARVLMTLRRNRLMFHVRVQNNACVMKTGVHVPRDVLVRSQSNKLLNAIAAWTVVIA